MEKNIYFGEKKSPNPGWSLREDHLHIYRNNFLHRLIMESQFQPQSRNPPVSPPTRRSTSTAGGS